MKKSDRETCYVGKCAKLMVAAQERPRPWGRTPVLIDALPPRCVAVCRDSLPAPGHHPLSSGRRQPANCCRSTNDPAAGIGCPGRRGSGARVRLVDLQVIDRGFAAMEFPAVVSAITVRRTTVRQTRSTMAARPPGSGQQREEGISGSITDDRLNSIRDHQDEQCRQPLPVVPVHQYFERQSQHDYVTNAKHQHSQQV